MRHGRGTRAASATRRALSADASRLLSTFAGCRLTMTSIASAGGPPAGRAWAAVHELRRLGLATGETGAGGSVMIVDRRALARRS